MNIVFTLPPPSLPPSLPPPPSFPPSLTLPPSLPLSSLSPPLPPSLSSPPPFQLENELTHQLTMHTSFSRNASDTPAAITSPYLTK